MNNLICITSAHVIASIDQFDLVRLSDCPIRDNQYFTTYNMYYTTFYKVT